MAATTALSCGANIRQVQSNSVVIRRVHPLRQAFPQNLTFRTSISPLLPNQLPRRTSLRPSLAIANSNESVETPESSAHQIPDAKPASRLDAVRSMYPIALNEAKVWLSDVIGRQQRPYFLNRTWTGKDISYAVYMIIVHSLCLAAPFTFSWDAFGCFVIMYIITGMFGITLSYHRHLSHKSFKLPKWLEYTFAYCGVQAVQGDPLEWVSAHRYHHQYCDTPADPHTPYEGFWHSHMGWLLDDKATLERVGVRGNIKDMATDPFYLWIEKTYTWHIAAMVALLYALGGWPFIVWGVALRVVWVYHITWAVNSAAHVWGTQEWNTGDLSRNNWWVAMLAFGEGWHNNHHAFEYSARHGLHWWQLDATWYTVKLLEALGLATKVRYPTKEHMAKLTFPERA